MILLSPERSVAVVGEANLVHQDDWQIWVLRGDWEQDSGAA